MGKVVAELKVMPTDKDLDLDVLEEEITSNVTEKAELSAIKREEVAFGLTALLVNVMIADEEGGTEEVEDSLSQLEKVESVTVENVGRV
ncbi:MAG: elongation factor 1-beta [Halobacteria archaeon]